MYQGHLDSVTQLNILNTYNLYLLYILYFIYASLLFNFAYYPTLTHKIIIICILLAYAYYTLLSLTKVTMLLIFIITH